MRRHTNGSPQKGHTVRHPLHDLCVVAVARRNILIIAIGRRGARHRREGRMTTCHAIPTERGSCEWHRTHNFDPAKRMLVLAGERRIESRACCVVYDVCMTPWQASTRLVALGKGCQP